MVRRRVVGARCREHAATGRAAVVQRDSALVARWQLAVRCGARVRGTGLGRKKLFVRVAGRTPRAWRGRSPANTGCCSHGGRGIMRRRSFSAPAVQQNPVSLEGLVRGRNCTRVADKNVDRRSVRMRRRDAPCVVDVGLPRVARPRGLAPWKRVSPATRQHSPPRPDVRDAGRARRCRGRTPPALSMVHPETCGIVHAPTVARSECAGLLTRVAAANAAEHYGAGSPLVRPHCSRTLSR